MPLARKGGQWQKGSLCLTKVYHGPKKCRVWQYCLPLPGEAPGCEQVPAMCMLWGLGQQPGPEVLGKWQPMCSELFHGNS